MRTHVFNVMDDGLISVERGCALTIAAFAVLLASCQARAQDDQPRVSASDPSYLGCTTWTGKEWTPFTARSARTKMVVSPRGYRAYAEVNVTIKNGFCENSTRLYVAPTADRAFKIVYAEPRSGTSGGNGIRLIGWSSDGYKLLAEVNLWEYETDRGFWHVPIIYDARTGTASEISTLDKAVTRHFGSDCEFEPAAEGWKGNEQILVKISRPPEDESYEQHFCVAEPVLLVFDLQKKTLQSARSEQ